MSKQYLENSPSVPDPSEGSPAVPDPIFESSPFVADFEKTALEMPHKILGAKEQRILMYMKKELGEYPSKRGMYNFLNSSATRKKLCSDLKLAQTTITSLKNRLATDLGIKTQRPKSFSAIVDEILDNALEDNPNLTPEQLRERCHTHKQEIVKTSQCNANSFSALLNKKFKRLGIASRTYKKEKLQDGAQATVNPQPSIALNDVQSVLGKRNRTPLLHNYATSKNTFKYKAISKQNSKAEKELLENILWYNHLHILGMIAANTAANKISSIDGHYIAQNNPTSKMGIQLFYKPFEKIVDKNKVPIPTELITVAEEQCSTPPHPQPKY
ncbi:MAG: hypothetical protein H2069_07095 [Legionella sp.]|nr:hypothetical protein [Legionella sp.]